MQKVIPIALLVLCGAAATPLALAQDEPPAPPQPSSSPESAGPPAQRFMQQFDTDQDGKVTLDEVKAPQTEQFKAIDADGDGAVSAEEASSSFKEKVPPEMLEAMEERGMPDPGETLINNLDTDSNGSVNQEEFEQPATKSFEKMDKDGDGSATEEEATAYFDQLREKLEKQMQQMQQMQQQQQPPSE
ncbi:MAG: hypothetical protein N838_22050 [Thiohalocapsa sp. PB-PSB1]|jgi:Ca2+-binding EF-hand superfamily protein|nr:MAG: hypothetical protein N838_33565 [Thiohalocapsa sp. PB-PSB1]QQO55627.1 MAG: hypothetical protein N838_22050 [Thiohalocapsa sp. PB-PSB1]HCS90733.1 hypothetical protein [Chromatiaceae bacterium]